MKPKLLGFIACMALLGVAPAAANTVYDVNDSSGSLSDIGTITTDGTIGVLSSADIISWSLTISGFGTPFTLTGGSNSVDFLFGGDLVGTASTLTFNFSDTSVGELQFLPESCYPCASVSYVTNGGSNTNEFQLDLFESPTSTESIATPRFGTEVIAQTPLPAALPLFGAGLGLMGLLARRRKGKATAAIAA